MCQVLIVGPLQHGMIRDPKYGRSSESALHSIVKGSTCVPWILDFLHEAALFCHLSLLVGWINLTLAPSWRSRIYIAAFIIRGTTYRAATWTSVVVIRSSIYWLVLCNILIDIVLIALPRYWHLTRCRGLQELLYAHWWVVVALRFVSLHYNGMYVSSVLPGSFFDILTILLLRLLPFNSEMIELEIDILW